MSAESVCLTCDISHTRLGFGTVSAHHMIFILHLAGDMVLHIAVVNLHTYCFQRELFAICLHGTTT